MPRPDPRPDSDLAATLAQIAAGTAGDAGHDFFETLVSNLAGSMGASHALVATTASEHRARTLACRTPRGVESGAEWGVTGTPFESVVPGEPHHCEIEARVRHPSDPFLREWKLESYFVASLRAPDGEVLGHLGVFHTAPMPVDPMRSAIFRIFAARAAAELARLRVERTLGESEERFRDLFDEAPIAYVQEGLDSRFIRANRAAIRTLGIKPEDVIGTVGMSFIPDTPEAQRRVREAFESIGRGTDTSGVVLELRRKDNGKPLWIQWWSKPDPGGKCTRTMFVDITERVLLEQEQVRLKEQNRYLREEIKSVHNFDEIVGRSAAFVGVLAKVDRVAKTDSSVLITGETGTGKELVARAIHSTSRRHDKPLIKLNCAALPTGLVESELFGHEKGAFSGAIARRIGRFELAHGGTIFLDEIGEVSPDVQVKLLRVLQEREFERVGGNTTIQADVRVIAATNRDLLRAVKEGKFREDLYYRLNVFPIHLPPLRERIDDIPLLVQFFLKKFSARIGKHIEGMSTELMRHFSAYPWPGNVRELENLLERAVILANGETLDVDAAPLLATSAEPAPHPALGRGTALESVEREHIVAMLERASWVIEGPSGAARMLDLHPNTLRSRMKKLGITRGTRAAT